MGAFGIDVDYAQLIKIYGPTPDAAGPERKYSPGECCGTRMHRLLGKPVKALVSTSYVEKHNQTMRQHMRRFTRLTNGHSKKIENHVHMLLSIRRGTILPELTARYVCPRPWPVALSSGFGIWETL